MARLPRLALPGHTHCLLQRAAPGRQPLAADEDRRAYLHALREAAATEQVALHGWGLHDTEVRLLATPATEGALGRLMQALGRRFVAALHRRHGGRGSGSPWDGRYRCTLVEPGAHRLQALLWTEAPGADEPEPGPEAEPAGGARSSAGHRLGRWRDPALAELPEVWALGNTPFEREAAWAALRARGLAPAQRERLLRAVRGGWPYGGEAFVSGLAQALQRPTVPRPRGRPAARGQADQADQPG
jgi:putative transposase